MTIHPTRRYVLGVGLSAMAGLSAPLAGRAAAAPLRIGVLNDQSGPYSSAMGPGSVVSAHMAVEDLGGNVLGRPVEIVVADHQNKVDIGAGIARQWCDADVGLIIDVGHSAIALAVQQIVREKNKIAIYTNVGTTQITEQACSPNGFSWCYDAYALSNGLVGSMAKHGLNDWFLLVTDYAFGHSLEEEVRAAVERTHGKVVGTVRHPEHATDFSPYILQAITSKAQILGLLNAGEDMVNALKQASEFGFGENGGQVAAPLVVITDVHAMGLRTAHGLTFMTSFYWDRTEASRRFGERFFKVHGAMPTMAQAAVYSGITHYLKSVAAAGTNATTAVLAAMRGMHVRDFYTEDGWLRADGRLMHNLYLVQVKTAAEAKRTWDYYKIVQTVPADQAFRNLAESKCPLVRS